MFNFFRKTETEKHLNLKVLPYATDKMGNKIYREVSYDANGKRVWGKFVTK